MLDKAAVFDAAKLGKDVEIVTASDPAMTRHRDELLGGQGETDPTPPQARYTQPGRVQLEWIGDVSPYAGEVMTALGRMHLLPKTIQAALQRVVLTIAFRVDGVTTRTLGERDGLSETITWGPRPGTYVREISAKDADRILSSSAGRQFRVVGWAGAHPSRDPIDLYLPSSLRPIARSVRVEIGPEEKLVGVLGGSGGQMGEWKSASR